MSPSKLIPNLPLFSNNNYPKSIIIGADEYDPVRYIFLSLKSVHFSKKLTKK